MLDILGEQECAASIVRAVSGSSGAIASVRMVSHNNLLGVVQAFL